MAALRAEEFVGFRSQLEPLCGNLLGTASFASMEEWLSIAVSGDGLGHFKAECWARDEAGIGNCLTFQLAFDQTEVPSIILGLRAIEEAFPVLGTLEHET